MSALFGVLSLVLAFVFGCALKVALINVSDFALCLPVVLAVPAIGLIITGILNWIGIPSVVMAMAYWTAGRGTGSSMLLWLALMALVFSSLMIVAGLKMKRLETYGLAVAGSVLAMLVTPGNLIGLPLGIC